MRIGFFGGSFDPPHVGHLTIAHAAAKAFSLDRILFVPTANQPLKPVGAVASYNDRLAMVQLLCDEEPAFEASTLEEPNKSRGANYTIDTLTKLRQQLSPADTLFVLVGADAFLDLRRWRQPDELLKIAEWIVVSRPGFSLNNLAPLNLTPEQQRRVHLLEGIAEPASATHIRDLLAADDDCTALLLPAVFHYVRSHHLYQHQSLT
jgi:nicotinate-nucleotide adenylyltransferase